MIWTVSTDLGPIVVREQIEPDDEPGILELFSACDDWFEATTGGPSGPGDVQSLFYVLPDGRSFEDKRLFTVRDGDKIVGLIDVVLGHPHPRAAGVGAFLIAPTHRRRGLGTAVAAALLEEARSARLEEVTAAAHDTWPTGTAFLHALGFTVGPVVEPTVNAARSPGEPAARRATLSLGA